MTDNKKDNDIRQSILSSNDRAEEPIEIPEWNFKGLIREINGRDAFAINQAVVNRTDESEYVEIYESYVIAGLHTLEGDRVFQDGDAPLLAQKNRHVVQRVYEKIAALSGIRDEDIEDAEKK